MRQAKFLFRPVLFESDWNWNLKFGFLGQYGQKTIFQIKWTKNTTIARQCGEGNLHESFLGKIFERKKLQNMLFSQVFSSRLFTWALLYLWAVALGFFCVALIYFFSIAKCKPLVNEILKEIESATDKQTKKYDFGSFKRFWHRQFFTTAKGMFKNTFWI